MDDLTSNLMRPTQLRFGSVELMLLLLTFWLALTQGVAGKPLEHKLEFK
jgi:hypothetical protein